jgi:Immunity protein 42
MSQVIAGEKERFAIESLIAEAYEEESRVGLGYFVIHILGMSYGINRSDATWLACSLDSVEELIEQRGKYDAAFARHPDAADLADAFRIVKYNGIEEIDPSHRLWNLCDNFENSVSWQWAPDGDQAFDDGSYVLYFNIGKAVRLVAFRCLKNGLHDPVTLRDLTLTELDFYDTLTTWRARFLEERLAMLETSKLLRTDGNAKLG